MTSEWTDPADGDGPSIDGVFCNARLRHRPRDGAEPAAQLGEHGLARFRWIGGRVWVDDREVRFRGSETTFNTNADTAAQLHASTTRHTAVVPAGVIESVAVRRGVVGVPYVAVTTTDGAQLQLRPGAFGKDSGRVVEAIEAAMAASGG